MLSKDEVLEQYRKFSVSRGASIYLTPHAAFDFLNTCEMNDLAVVGIEGFVYDGRFLKPQLDMIADFSSAKSSNWQEFREICNRLAKSFLQDLSTKDDLVINFVILSPGELMH